MTRKLRTRLRLLLLITGLVQAGLVSGAAPPKPDTLRPGYNTFSAKLDSLMTNRLTAILVGKPRISEKPGLTNAALQPLTDTVVTRRLLRIRPDIQVPYHPKILDYIRLLVGEKPEATSILLGLADHYCPQLLPLLRQQGIPEELCLLPGVLSAFNTYSGFADGNSGLWQLSYLTGKLGKLRIDSFVDDRRDITSSTRFVAAHLKELFDIYNDWPLTIATLGCGPSVVNKAIRRAGGKKDFWSVYPYLPAGTRDIVPAFLALLCINDSQADFGVIASEANKMPRTDTVCIQGPLALQRAAQVLDIPADRLRFLNPRYRKDIIPGEQGGLPFCLPSECIGLLNARMDSLRPIIDTVRGKNGVVNPPAARQESAPAGNGQAIHYNVRSGDTLGGIAMKYKVSVNELMRWNNLHSNKLRVNQKLVIYRDKSTKK